MKAVRFHDHGSAAVLTFEDVPDPTPALAEVVVRVEACSVQHSDLDVRSGVSRFPLRLPHTLGLEYAGEVVAAGSEVRDLTVGDRVTTRYQVHCGDCSWCRAGRESLCENATLPGVHFPGGYAEYATIDERGVAPLAEAISYEHGAAKNSYTTAWHALVIRGSLRAGELVLVNAAGSGLGTAAVQIATLLGAQVIASAGSDEKVAKAVAGGAAHGVNYEQEDLASAIAELTRGRGVDVVLECVGGDVFSASVMSLARGGRLIVVGGHAGELVPLDLIPFFRNELSVVGSVRASAGDLARVLELLAAGDLDPVIDSRFPLAAAAAAHEALESRRNYGKILLLPWSRNVA